MRIGLLYSNPSESYLSAFLVGSLDEASHNHTQFIVEKCELGDRELEVARHMIGNGVDGLILPSPLCDSQDLLELIAEEGVPAVLVGSGIASTRHAAISIDEHAAAYKMTRHIVALGHTRIGFIIGNPAQTASAARLAGFKSAMAAATVAVAHKRRLDVLGDLTVCGFDDTALATAIWPELTTIRQPIGDMARVAIKLLAKLLRHGGHAENGPREHLVLESALIRRQSDAPPRR